MGTLIKTRYPVVYFDNFDISNQEQLKYKKEDIKSYIEDIKSDLMSLSMLASFNYILKIRRSLSAPSRRTLSPRVLTRRVAGSIR